MIRFILTRLSLIVPTFFGLTLAAFFLIRLIPGDPIETLAGERGIDAARHAKLLKEYGLDQPLIVQYWFYIKRVFSGELGTSIVTNYPIWTEFKALFPATLELAICAILFAIAVGLPAGILAALRRNTIADHGVMGAALFGYSMPIFWWALLLIMLFSTTLGWTPVNGRIDVLYYIEPVTGFMLIDTLLSGEEGAFSSAVSHLILPTIVLSTIPLAVIARMTRSSMLEVLGEDYIRTARAKGLSTGRVIGIHALRNALIPVVTVIGLQVGVLLTGAILTEYVFSWPGIGTWLLKGIQSRDYPVLQGGILMVGCLVMLVNLLVDLAYGLINPRIRSSR
jgi:ABC-type dipeptide/oligopeptide/nickel transport systems, permease components